MNNSDGFKGKKIVSYEEIIMRISYLIGHLEAKGKYKVINQEILYEYFKELARDFQASGKDLSEIESFLGNRRMDISRVFAGKPLLYSEDYILKHFLELKRIAERNLFDLEYDLVTAKEVKKYIEDKLGSGVLAINYSSLYDTENISVTIRTEGTYFVHKGSEIYRPSDMDNNLYICLHGESGVPIAEDSNEIVFDDNKLFYLQDRNRLLFISKHTHEDSAYRYRGDYAHWRNFYVFEFSDSIQGTKVSKTGRLGMIGSWT